MNSLTLDFLLRSYLAERAKKNGKAIFQMLKDAKSVIVNECKPKILLE